MCLEKQVSLHIFFSASERVRAPGCLCVYISIMENGAVVFECFGVSLGLAAGHVSQCYQTQRGASLHMNNN